MSDAVVIAFREFNAAQQTMLAAAERLREAVAAEAGISTDRVGFITEAVATHFGLTKANLLSKRRTDHIVVPRQVAMWMCRQLTTVSYEQIGHAFGGMSHGTVIHGVGAIADRISTDPEFAARVQRLRTQLEAALP